MRWLAILLLPFAIISDVPAEETLPLPSERFTRRQCELRTDEGATVSLVPGTPLVVAKIEQGRCRVWVREVYPFSESEAATSNAYAIGWLNEDLTVPYDDAGSYFVDQAAAKPQDASLAMAVAVVRWHYGNPQSLEDFRNVLASVPDNPRCLLLRAQLLRGDGRREESLKAFQAVLDVEERCVAALHGRAATLLSAGQAAEALADCEKAVSIAGESSRELALRGYCKSMIGDLDGAQRDFEKARNLPMSPDEEFRLHVYGSGLLIKHRRLREAESELTSAVAMLSRIPERYQFAGAYPVSRGEDLLAFRGRAHVRHELGHDDDALSDVNAALKLFPSDAMALNIRASIYLSQEKAEFALIDLNRALEAEPKMDVLYANRAHAYLLKENWREAFNDLSRVIGSGTAPTALKAWCLEYRALVFKELGEPARAAEDTALLQVISKE
jgi:tetratricopeptide (TPR) repeat protein